jgi:hypothetical protein
LPSYFHTGLLRFSGNRCPAPRKMRARCSPKQPGRPRVISDGGPVRFGPPVPPRPAAELQPGRPRRRPPGGDPPKGRGDLEALAHGLVGGGRPEGHKAGEEAELHGRRDGAAGERGRPFLQRHIRTRMTSAFAFPLCGRTDRCEKLSAARPPQGVIARSGSHLDLEMQRLRTNLEKALRHPLPVSRA